MKHLNGRAYFLKNIPEGVYRDDWETTVRFSTRNDKKVSKKEILKNLNLLTKRRLSKKERDYQKLGENLSFIDKGLLEKHLNFIKGLFHFEKKRQENIEKKALQLISQSSIIISIITLAIVILFSKFSLHDSYWFYVLILLFLLILCFLFSALYFAIVALKIKLFNRPPHTLIVSSEAMDEKSFIYTETKLLYNAVEENIDVDNKKVMHMNRGYSFFKWAILIIIFFSILTFYSIYQLESIIQ